MKNVFTLFSCLLISALIFAQSYSGGPKSLALKVIRNKGYVDTNMSNCCCGPEEFTIVDGCLSSFVVNGKKLSYYRIVSITSDSLIIARPGDDDPRIRIAPRDITSMSTIIWCVVPQGVGWQPADFDAKLYTFTIRKQSEGNFTFNRKFCWDELCEKLYYGFLYCDPNYNCEFIFKKDGAYYIYGEGEAEMLPFNINN